MRYVTEGDKADKIRHGIKIRAVLLYCMDEVLSIDEIEEVFRDFPQL